MRTNKVSHGHEQLGYLLYIFCLCPWPPSNSDLASHALSQGGKKKRQAKPNLLSVTAEGLMYSAFESGGHEKLLSLSHGCHSLDANDSKPSFFRDVHPQSTTRCSKGLFCWYISQIKLIIIELDWMESQEIWFKSYSCNLFLHGHVLNVQNLCALPSILSDGGADFFFSLFPSLSCYLRV